MTQNFIPFWKGIPFFRILAPFTTGIAVEAACNIPYFISVSILIICLSFQFIYILLPFLLRIKYATSYGIILFVLFIMMGVLLTRQNNIEHTVKSLYHFHKTTATLVITLEQKPVKKTQYYKAIAYVQYEIDQKKLYPLSGKIITYFNNPSALDIGSQIMISGSIQKIPANNNPGDFDFSRYAKLQGITHQFIPGSTSYIILSNTRKKNLTRFLNNCREKIIHLIRTYIPDARNAGLAEALLIGYRNDLDKELIQSYSNTGVVHIIAISGLHIGLIYYLLLLAFKPLKRFKSIYPLSPLFILCGLWLFTLLAGAQPSILRSTIMFTFIIIGQATLRKPSVYNSLCMSAFFLLCYNPNWLWDIGFQLSYTALVSILLFSRPIYNWFYFPNKLVDAIWQLNAVTIAAQLLTTPVCIFHFHQFPVYFLVSNFIAVPLSSFILLGEIFLCCITILPKLASLVGAVVNWLIGLMNQCIEQIGHLPFALWQGLQINFWQTVLLSGFILLVADWVQSKRKNIFFAGISLLTLCIAIQSYEVVIANTQRQFVVYNNRNENIAEFIAGRNAYQYRDSITDQGIDPILSSHTFFRIKNIRSLNTGKSANALYYFDTMHVLMVRGSINLPSFSIKPRIDVLVFSGKPGTGLNTIARHFEIKQVVVAGNLPARIVHTIRAECDSLNIKFHDVKEKGAFVITLR